ncbi:LEA type 2 family protein [Aromatoleum buckelii]|uniref:Water stress/hypersensitive response domain-containing protein n=1 Tax=Aromatoleum buckelii TaxID=200254 RepID=A0ABX1N6F4_9RHOO|nr:LEA type 2 family protein [Aromatoleum buckelii]MCK0511543.1 LEA type 2 family protein [Aromatoleum buckelii]
MLSHPGPVSVRILLGLATLLLALALGGCAGMLARDPVRMTVVGIEPLPGEGLEMRFNLKLRLQNPNEVPLDYDGLAVELELNGKPFASGVSDRKGSVPRFGETLFRVPVTVSAFTAMRQALAIVEGDTLDDVPYVLRGKLGGGAFGVTRFSEKGTLSLPGTGDPGK